MKRCNSCNNQYSDSYSTCPDCGKLLTKITEEDIEKENEERQRLADIKRQRLEAYRQNSRGTGALSTLGILCAVLDALMTALFIANSNLSGAALTIAGLIFSVIGTLILKKPEMFARMGASKAEKKEETVSDYRQLKTLGTALIIIGVICTGAQIVTLASLVGEIMGSVE